MANYTFLPTATGTGAIGMHVEHLAYALAHDSATGEAPYTESASSCFAYNRAYSAGHFQVIRGFLRYDTSAIGADPIINARMHIRAYNWGSSIYEDDAGYATVVIVEGVQSNPLALTDYGDELVKTTSGGQITNAEWLTGGSDPHLILNATGRSWINPNGITTLCVRLISDINNNEPTGTNLANIGTGGGVVLEVNYSANNYTANSATTINCLPQPAAGHSGGGGGGGTPSPPPPVPAPGTMAFARYSYPEVVAAPHPTFTLPRMLEVILWLGSRIHHQFQLLTTQKKPLRITSRIHSEFEVT